MMKFIPHRNSPAKGDHPRLYEGVEIDLDDEVVHRLLAAGLGSIVKERKPAPKAIKSKKITEVVDDVESSDDLFDQTKTN